MKNKGEREKVWVQRRRGGGERVRVKERGERMKPRYSKLTAWPIEVMQWTYV